MLSAFSCQLAKGNVLKYSWLLLLIFFSVFSFSENTVINKFYTDATAARDACIPASNGGCSSYRFLPDGNYFYSYAYSVGYTDNNRIYTHEGFGQSSGCSTNPDPLQISCTAHYFQIVAACPQGSTEDPNTKECISDSVPCQKNSDVVQSLNDPVGQSCQVANDLPSCPTLGGPANLRGNPTDTRTGFKYEYVTDVESGNPLLHFRRMYKKSGWHNKYTDDYVNITFTKSGSFTGDAINPAQVIAADGTWLSQVEVLPMLHLHRSGLVTSIRKGEVGFSADRNFTWNELFTGSANDTSITLHDGTVETYAKTDDGTDKLWLKSIVKPNGQRVDIVHDTVMVDGTLRQRRTVTDERGKSLQIIMKSETNNLLVNGEFDNGLNGWFVVNATNASTGVQTEGVDHHLHIAPSGTTKFWQEVVVNAVSKDSVVSLSYDFKGDFSRTDNNVNITRLFYLDGNGAGLGSYRCNSSDGTVEVDCIIPAVNTWTTKKITFSGVPIGTRRIRVEFEVRDNHTPQALNASYDSFALRVINSQILKVIAPDGEEYLYDYTDDGLLSSVTYPDGEVLGYGYGDTNGDAVVDDNDFDYPSYLTSKTKNGSLFAKFTYDSKGRVITSERGTPAGAGDGVSRGAEHFSFAYTENSAGLITSTTVTNALGKEEVLHYQEFPNGQQQLVHAEGLASASCVAGGDRFSYDAKGQLRTKTDAKLNVVETVRNDRDLVETERTGLRWVGDAVDGSLMETPISQKITTTWHPDAALPLTRHYGAWDGSAYVDYRSESSSYTPEHRLQRFIVTDLTHYTVPYSTHGRTQQWDYSYTYWDTEKTQLKTQSIDGPIAGTGDTTTYHYDVEGNQTHVVNAKGHTTLFANHNSRGQPTTITDANGVITTLMYTLMGELDTVTTAGEQVMDIDYNNRGLVDKVTLADGSFLRYFYNDAEHLVAIENNAGERIENTQLSLLDGSWTTQVIKDSTANIMHQRQRILDELGRVKTHLTADNHSTQYQYDENGNRYQVTDARSHITTQSFDGLDRLTKVAAPDQQQTEQAVQLSYDAQGRLHTLTDQRGLVTTYHYDGFGNLIQQISPDTGTTTYGYDKANNRTTMTDAKGVVTHYSYDALNRLQTVTYPAANADENITYSYDDNSNDANGTKNYGIGLLTGITDHSGTTSYRYDARGNLVATTTRLDTVDYVNSYTYNTANQLVTHRYPSGRLVNYSYDNQGRINGITTQDNPQAIVQTVVSNVTYEPFGPIKSYSYGNGVTRTLSHDQNYRITAIQGQGNSPLMQRGYTYDPNGNILTLNNSVDNSQNQSFGYDPFNRLNQASGAYGSLSYQYDGVGNRTQQVTTQGGNTTTDSYHYSNTSNRLDRVVSQTGGTTTQRDFQYDPNGNLINDSRADGTLLGLSYNAANRFRDLLKNSVLTAQYQYNALGQRVKKTLLPDTVHHFHYGQGGQLLAISKGDGTPDRDYVYLGAQQVGMFTHSAATASNRIFFDFETAAGWTVNAGGTDTATTGQWERGQPQATTDSGITVQLGTTVSGDHCLVTGALSGGGAGAGAHDVDGGITSIRSPALALPAISGNQQLHLQFSYYLAHTPNGRKEDRFTVVVIDNQGTRTTVFSDEATNGKKAGNWQVRSANLSAFAGQTVHLEITASDNGTGSLIEAAVDDLSIDVIQPHNILFEDDFETDKGWITNPGNSDTATKGQWQRANPQPTAVDNLHIRQLGNAVSGQHSLVTGALAGISAGGEHDIDGGVTRIRSPLISLPSLSGNQQLSLSLNYYLSHSTNASSDDYLRIRIIPAGSNTNTGNPILEELGANNNDAAQWQGTSLSLNSYAGQSIHIQIEAADNATGSLIEAGIDNIRVQRLDPDNPAPTPQPTATVQSASYYIHNDHLNTPQLVTDQQQQIVWQRQQHPFGKTTAITQGITLDSRFPGQQFEEESGFSYNYYRHYDPSTGRYIQGDPIGITYDNADPQIMMAVAIGGLNRAGYFGDINHLYGYVLQNPIRFIDPLGLYCYVQRDTGTRVCSTASELGYGGGYSDSGSNSAYPTSFNNQCVQDCIAREIEQCPSYPTRSRDIRSAAAQSSICAVAVVTSCTVRAADCDEDNQCEDE